MTIPNRQVPTPGYALVIAATLLAVLPFFCGCNRSASTAGEMSAPKVTTTSVVSQETVDTDEYTGQTEATEMVEVRARVFGYLKTIEFKDGDFVKEDQPLFTIEPDEYEAIHKQSLSKIDLNAAQLELAKAKLARNEPLVKTGAVTREEYDESIAAVKSAEATITAARADANKTAVDLKYTVVKAPISGRIDRALVTKGNLLTGGLTSGTLLTKIVREQPMYAYFDVDERSLLRYMRKRETKDRDATPGSLRDLDIPCYLQLADEKDFSHEGTLDFAATEVSRSTGTVRIRGVFPNEDRALASGLFVRVRIPVSDPYEALLIPEQALATDQSVKFVYVVSPDGTANRQTVELGRQRGDLRIITAGLKAGDQVIVKGLQRVKPGQKVEATLVPTTLPSTTVPKAPPKEPKSVSKEPAEKESADPNPEPEPDESTPQPRRTPKEP